MKRKLRVGESPSLSKAYTVGCELRTSVSIVILLKLRSLDRLPEHCPRTLDSTE